MTSNLDLWDKVSRVPKEHLKAFDNGKFKGTAIKPMWSIKTATEAFGPMGQGWGISWHKFTQLPVSEAETMLYCEVQLWYVNDKQTVVGIGGDWAIRGGKGQDEAYKKAYTDALTNALKHIGVAADIHMGLWDGNKYVDEQKPKAVDNNRPSDATMYVTYDIETDGATDHGDYSPSTGKLYHPVVPGKPKAETNKSTIGLLPSAHNATKAATRDPMQQLCAEIEATKGLNELRTWGVDNAGRIDVLNDDLKETVRNSYSEKQSEHKKALSV